MSSRRNIVIILLLFTIMFLSGLCSQTVAADDGVNTASVAVSTARAGGEPINATKHPFLYAIIKGIGETAKTFGAIATGICSFDVTSTCGSALDVFKSVGSGLVTFFMLIEICSFCFNVDFNQGIESVLKIAIKLAFLQIIVDNVPIATELVMDLLKGECTTKFADVFEQIVTPFNQHLEGNSIGAMSSALGILEPLLYGVVLLVLWIVIFIIFTVIIASMCGIVFETAIIVALSPVAVSTLVSSQVRQTGISYLKNVAAITMQWSVISICFTVYAQISTSLFTQDTLRDLAVAGGTTSLAVTMLSDFLSDLGPILSLIILCICITKSGDITKRALGS